MSYHSPTENQSSIINTQQFWPLLDCLQIAMYFKKDGVIESEEKRTATPQLFEFRGIKLRIFPKITASNYTHNDVWVYVNVLGELALFVTYDKPTDELFLHVINEDKKAAPIAHIDLKPVADAFGEVWNEIVASYFWDGKSEKWVQFNAEDIFVVEGSETSTTTNSPAEMPQ